MDDNMNISGGTPENNDSFGDTAGVWDSLTGDAPAAHNDTQETVQPDTAQDTAEAAQTEQPQEAQAAQPQSADMGAQPANGMPAGGAQGAQGGIPPYQGFGQYGQIPPYQPGYNVPPQYPRYGAPSYGYQPMYGRPYPQYQAPPYNPASAGQAAPYTPYGGTETQAPPLNGNGSIFDEKSFAPGAAASNGTPAPAPAPMPAQTGIPQYQPTYPQYGQIPQYQAGYQTPPPAEPIVPAVSEPAPKKSASTPVLIISAVVVVALLSAVMLLLAKNEKNGGTVADTMPTPVSVNIEVDKRPAEDKSDYADEAKGLFTTEGAIKYMRPSVVSLYCYKENSVSVFASASGIVISEDGYIVTNAHVVDDIDRVSVVFTNGDKCEATILAFDSRSDLAVIKVNRTGLTKADFGSSADLRQGEQVISLGNADGFEESATLGIVSYPEREIDSYTGFPIKCIQTDAALNHGQSGGPVIDLYGRVVGIVVSKHYQINSDTENIGFAIASDYAVPIIEGLIKDGYVKGRARMGIHYTLITPEAADKDGIKPGLLITSLDEGFDICDSGLKVGDIITEIDGKPMYTMTAIKSIPNEYKPGDKVKAKVYRKDQFSNEEPKEFEIEFTFGEFGKGE
ncbi:MAG: trypsin-like peptidase domain-containing protein [Oscillospiraceae bacterium]|nr:trypsin-like peptidase domain-containing protein [Oscillospiraceae bacterium]